MSLERRREKEGSLRVEESWLSDAGSPETWVAWRSLGIGRGGVFVSLHEVALWKRILPILLSAPHPSEPQVIEY
jgi:hypothetical protein